MAPKKIRTRDWLDSDVQNNIENRQKKVNVDKNKDKKFVTELLNGCYFYCTYQNSTKKKNLKS